MKTFTHEQYLSPFTWRYGSDEMRYFWGEIHRRKLWRRVWVALAKAQSEAGLVSAEQVADLEAHQDDIDLDRAHDLERELRHDVMSEIHTYAEQCKVGGGIIHLGATSMDVLDNADVLRLRDALILIAQRMLDLMRVLAERIEQWADLPTMAFTHMQPAEPTTVGYRLAVYGQDLLMDWQELQRVREGLWGKGIKGAVGTAASYEALLQDTGMTPADLESRVMDLLDLPAFPIATQTYPRKQDWHIGNALAGIAGTLYKFAFDLRLLQSLGEWGEPMGEQQVGSTAMPFKRNPVKAENIDSLGRWVAAQIQVLWDNASHSLLERTLDDSANRREILPSLCLAVEEMLLQGRRLVDGLQVNTTGIERNLATFGPFAAVERLLMMLGKAGADRQAMHERLRQHSLGAWEALQRGEDNPLLELVINDDGLLQLLTKDQIQAAMHVDDYVGDAPHRALHCATMLRRITGT